MQLQYAIDLNRLCSCHFKNQWGEVLSIFELWMCVFTL